MASVKMFKPACDQSSEHHKPHSNSSACPSTHRRLGQQCHAAPASNTNHGKVPNHAGGAACKPHNKAGERKKRGLGSLWGKKKRPEDDSGCSSSSSSSDSESDNEKKC
uniref:Uncharacterized protein n=1 Tax=Kalanchoe fedtschenkoi TaxID=63787 RepID=A0A7N0UGN5_KALFE